MYSSIPYALAQGDVELPYLLAQGFVYSIVTYFMIRCAPKPASSCRDANVCMLIVIIVVLPCRYEYSAAKFFWYTLFMVLSLTYYTYYGELPSTHTPLLLSFHLSASN